MVENKNQNGQTKIISKEIILIHQNSTIYKQLKPKIMAETKFTAIYVNNESKIIEREIPGMNTYKIAEKFAKMLNDPEETKLVCVIESWKLYPKENEKTKKDQKI